MGCQTEVYLGQNLTFSVVSHDPDTGGLADADAVPAYRVYETETATPLLTGNMAKLDDANTTGFYTETIACTTANGFEVNKSYTVYISAAVGGTTGGIAYGFRVDNTTRQLSQTAAEVAAILSGTTITIHRGDTLDLDITGLGDISERTKLWFTVKRFASQADTEAIVQIEETAGLAYLNGTAGTAINGDITVTDAAAGDITITMAAAATASLEERTGMLYDVQMLTAAGITTLTAGAASVSADVTRVVS